MAPVSERKIVFLVGAVQFINILDFMIVAPLGPDFAAGLSIHNDKIGYIVGSYTAAAALAGLAGAFFLDRFDRRKALLVAMLGLVMGTAAGAFATGLGSLMAARMIAGAFGGPATSLCYSIIADVIPAERRGKAVGAVMGAFAAASVLGVPAGLRLALWGSWRTPFLAVAGAGVLVSAGAVFLLPPMRRHLEARAADHKPLPLRQLLTNRLVLLSYAMTFGTMMAGFVLIPFISPYLQKNLGYPRSGIDILYLVGGLFSFFTMRIVGWLVDRYGSFRIGSLGSLALISIVWVGFFDHVEAIPIMVLFVAFMVAMGFRNVSYNTLTTKVPSVTERARFMSVQSAVQHLASAAGAGVASQMLWERHDQLKSLGGIPRIALLSMALTATLPLLLWLVETRLRRRDRPAVAVPQELAS